MMMICLHQDFHDDDLFIVFLFCSLYVPFRDFSGAFCPATVVSVAVCLVVLGLLSLQKCLVFFLLSDVFFFVSVVLFDCLQLHAVCAEIKVAYVENPEL